MYEFERAEDTLEERIASGGFRCSRCAMVKPLPWIDQDGYQLCRRCADPVGVIDSQIMLAEAKAKGGYQPLTPLPIPPVAAFVGASVVTSISPNPISLTRGGSAVTVTIGGQNFSTTDTFTTNASNVTITTTLVSSKLFYLSLVASGGSAGNFDLQFDAEILTPKGMIQVR